MAGVYINGMEMPDYGYVCLKVFSNGDVVMTKEKRGSLVITGINEHIGRATPVPDHGRLIDLDAFLDGCKKLSEENDPEETEVHLEFLRHFFDKILPTPTIIPADKEGEHG